MKIKNKSIDKIVIVFGVAWLQILKPFSSNRKTVKASTFVNKYSIGV